MFIDISVQSLKLQHRHHLYTNIWPVSQWEYSYLPQIVGFLWHLRAKNCQPQWSPAVESGIKPHPQVSLCGERIRSVISMYVSIRSVLGRSWSKDVFVSLVLLLGSGIEWMLTYYSWMKLWMSGTAYIISNQYFSTITSNTILCHTMQTSGTELFILLFLIVVISFCFSMWEMYFLHMR